MHSAYFIGGSRDQLAVSLKQFPPKITTTLKVDGKEYRETYLKVATTTTADVGTAHVYSFQGIN